MDNQNEFYGDGFRHRRPPGPILVAPGAHSEGFVPVERPSTTDRPIEMSRLLPRPSLDIEVNELVDLSGSGGQHARSGGLTRIHHDQWNGSDAESLVSQAASSSNFSR